MRDLVCGRPLLDFAIGDKVSVFVNAALRVARVSFFFFEGLRRRLRNRKHVPNLRFLFYKDVHAQRVVKVIMVLRRRKLVIDRSILFTR